MISNLPEAIALLFPTQWGNLSRVPTGGEAAVKAGLIRAVATRSEQLWRDPGVNVTAVEDKKAELDARKNLLESIRKMHDATHAELTAAESKAVEPGRGTAARVASFLLMLLFSMGFGALTIPTFELLVFTDATTGLLVQHAAAKSWGAGMFLGIILCLVSLYAAEGIKLDADPSNDGKESFLKFLPFIAGIIMLLAMAVFRIAQIGPTLGVWGLILAEFVLVLLIELVAWVHNSRFSRRKNEFPQLFADSINRKRQETQTVQLEIDRLDEEWRQLTAKYMVKQLAASAAGDPSQVPAAVQTELEPLLDAELALRPA
ncbi:MAG: hypothetical protein VX265_19050 [Myxococcota bacterium]|nr:hypothetical protein [Myxococcota bacterium]MEC8424138.1 hypothetical protein [Myxococcota bacterium]